MRAAATDTKFKAVLYIYDNSVTNTAKVNKYARKGSVVVKKFIAHFRTIKLLFLLKIYHCEIWTRFWCLNWRKRGEFAPEFQVLSQFSLVFINTTASSEVVNVFSCKNSQFQLPHNFISQIDRESIALSLESHFLMAAMHQEGIFAVEKWQNWWSR